VSVRRSDNSVAVEVADSGAGIDPDSTTHLFDRFKPDLNLDSNSGQGAGLGLYLARRVAELHDGTITVKSTKGNGSRFKIELPDGRPHAA
jgi:signal transduction histidine kinase